MIEISVKHDIDDLVRKLRSQQRQVQFAAVKALTNTAKDAARDVQVELPRVLDRPTRFTERSIRWQMATKQTMASKVYIAPIAAGYLGPLISGGTVKPKGRALVLAGADPLNTYGNIPRTRVKRLLKQRGTFAGRVKGIGGIWQRLGQGHVKLLIRFEDEQRKRAQFPFPEMVAKSVRKNWDRNFHAALDYAMRTAH